MDHRITDCICSAPPYSVHNLCKLQCEPSVLHAENLRLGKANSVIIGIFCFGLNIFNVFSFLQYDGALIKPQTKHALSWTRGNVSGQFVQDNADITGC